MSRSKPNLYFISVILTMLILPVISVLLDRAAHSAPICQLIGKWFVFWAIGIRLFLAGLRQASKPSFTAKEIFHIQGTESFAVIRELGYGNLAIGAGGIVSLLHPEWTSIMAIVGGLYFGLAGSLHLFKKLDSFNEIIALVSDLFIFIVMAAYVVCSLL
jgi:hypothetical protein